MPWCVRRLGMTVLPHFTQECVDVALDLPGTYPCVFDERIAGTTGIAFSLRRKHLIGQHADLLPQIFETITESTTKFAAFFGGQQHPQSKTGNASKKYTPTHCTHYAAQRVIFHELHLRVE